MFISAFADANDDERTPSPRRWLVGERRSRNLLRSRERKFRRSCRGRLGVGINSPGGLLLRDGTGGAGGELVDASATTGGASSGRTVFGTEERSGALEPLMSEAPVAAVTTLRKYT